MSRFINVPRLARGQGPHRIVTVLIFQRQHDRSHPLIRILQILLIWIFVSGLGSKMDCDQTPVDTKTEYKF